MSTTPDYGEPWKLRTEGSRNVIINPGATGADFDLPIHAARASSCVNACQGMTDPAAEIESMREAIKEAHTTLESIAKAKPSEWGEMSDQFKPWAQNRARHALTKLKPFIKP